MKYKIRYLVVAILMFGFLIAVPIVKAEDGGTGSGSGSDSTSSSSDSNSTSTDSNSTDTSGTETETEIHARDNRLEDLKKSLHINLSVAEKDALKKVCRPAQSVVAKIKTNFGNSVTKRTQAYTELQKNLNNLLDKLKAKGADTTALEQEINTLKTKFDNYKTDLANYQQTLTDLKAVDCQADPDAFQAALDAARTAHQKLVDDTVDIKSYVRGTVRPTLEAIKKSLEGTESNNTTTTSGGNQ